MSKFRNGVLEVEDRNKERTLIVLSVMMKKLILNIIRSVKEFFVTITSIPEE